MSGKPEKKGLFGRVLDSMYTGDGSETSTPSVAPEAPASTTRPVFGTSTSQATPGPRLMTRADPELVDSLREKVNEGSDAYGKFIELLDGLREAVPDERARFKAALVSMKSLGFDAGAVRALFSQRVAAAEDLADEFERAYKRNVEQVTSGSTARIKKLDSDIGDLQSQIDDRAAKLSDLKQERRDSELEQQRSVSKINEQGEAMRDALKVLNDEVTRERDRVSQLIS